MSYELINEKLKIYSCSVLDLTMRQANGFLKTWDDESTIGSLTVFYDHEDDRIVLNKDHMYFEDYKDIISEYIERPQDIREQFNDDVLSELIIEIFNVLDKVLYCRNLKETKKLVKYQIYPMNCRSIMDILDSIYDHRNPSTSRLDIYNYGYIQGKRVERKKRKNQREREKQKLLATGECKFNSKVNSKTNVSEAKEDIDKNKKQDLF